MGVVARPSIHWTIAVGLAHIMTMIVLFVFVGSSLVAFLGAFSLIETCNQNVENQRRADAAQDIQNESQCQDFCDVNGMTYFSSWQRGRNLFQCVCVQPDRHIRHNFLCLEETPDVPNNCYYD